MNKKTKQNNKKNHTLHKEGAETDGRNDSYVHAFATMSSCLGCGGILSWNDSELLCHC